MVIHNKWQFILFVTACGKKKNTNLAKEFDLFHIETKHCTILFFRSQILSLSFVKIMSQIQSLSFCGTFSMKWATILSWSRSDHSQSFQKVRFTTKICIFRKYFGMLFFKYILYQKRTKFQAGIVVKKILTKIFANFLKFFVVFDEILSVFISKKDLERFDLEIFFYPKKLSQILSLSR